MQIENEFRVRPVTRYALTHYLREEGARGSCREIGEFSSVERAEEVGVALQSLVPGSTLTTIVGRTPGYPPPALAAAMAVRAEPKYSQYVIVERGFDVETRAYYADWGTQAEEYRDQLQKHTGREWRIFECPITDPVRIAQYEAGRFPQTWAPLTLA